MQRTTPYALRWVLLCLPAMLALPAQATDVDVDTTISGVTSNNNGDVYNFGVNNANLTLTISNGGILTNAAAGTIGVNATADNNVAIVNGSNSAWYMSGGLTVGRIGSGNSLIITNGGTVYSPGASGIGIGVEHNPGSDNRASIMAGGLWDLGNNDLTLANWGGQRNVLTIDAGIVTNVAMYKQGDNNGSIANSLIITNGGRFCNSGNSEIGMAGGSPNNEVIVTGINSVWRQTGGTLYVGGQYSSTYNRLIVDNGGAVYSPACQIGTSGYPGNNTNTVLLMRGGVWEPGSLTLGKTANYGNAVTNQSGVLQFATATPSVSIDSGAGNRIVMNGGTLSYRNVSGVDITDNTNITTGVGLFSWTGANTFRLNNGSGTNSLGIPYVFSGSLGPTNYAGLELVNGTTSFRGPGIRIDSTGTILFSNTTATIYGSFTNAGALTITNSTVTCNAGCTLADGATVNWSGTNSVIHVTGTLILTGIKTFNVSGIPLDVLPITLFTSTAISDSGIWRVYPGQYRVIRAGTTLRLSRTSGTVVVVM